MKILTFTTLFPNNRFPLHGLFVKARMEAIARCCRLEVLAPVPWFPPLRFHERYYNYSQVVEEEWIGPIRVSHPRFFLLPKIGKVWDGLLLFLSTYPVVKELQRRFPFDLIDTHFAYPDGYAGYLLARAFGKPYTVTIRGSDLNLLTKYPLRYRLIHKTLSRANRVISVSQALKNAAIRIGVPEDNIIVIPNGVDLTKFFPIARQQARKYLKLPPNRRIILSVGHLCELKGFHLLIDAIGELIKKVGQDLLLVIVGGNSVEGDFKTFLEERITRQRLEDYVKLVGPRPPDELRFWYNAADLFCLASSREGWPNVCFESLACGVPVVATQVGGIPEIICSPDYGLLLNDRTSEALAAGIEQGLKTKWNSEEMVEYAQQNSWEYVAGRVIKVFQSICQNSLL